MGRHRLELLVADGLVLPVHGGERDMDMRERGDREKVTEEPAKKGGAGDLLVTGACWGWRNGGEAE